MTSRELTIEGVLIRRGNGHLTPMGALIMAYVPRVALTGHSFLSQRSVMGELEIGRAKADRLLTEFWDLGVLEPKRQNNGAMEALPGPKFDAWCAELTAAGVLRSVAWAPGGSPLARWNEWAGTVVSESDIAARLSHNQLAAFRQIARVSAESDQTATLSLLDVALLSELTKSQAQKAVDQLLEKGWLDVVEGRSGTARTFVLALSEAERKSILAHRERRENLEKASRINAEITDKQMELEYYLQVIDRLGEGRTGTEAPSSDTETPSFGTETPSSGTRDPACSDDRP